MVDDTRQHSKPRWANATAAELALRVRAEQQIRMANHHYGTALLKLEAARRDRAQAVLAAQEAGLSLREIGELLGVHFTRVRQLLEEAGGREPKRLADLLRERRKA